MDVSQLCSSEGYLPYVQSVLGVGDYLMIYSDDGSSTAGVWCMSLSDGSMKRVDVATSGNYLMNLVAYTNGTALTEAWADNGQSVNFYSIDPAAGTSTQISSLPVDNYDSFNSLAVDTANGTVYCVKGGEIHTLDLMTGCLLYTSPAALHQCAAAEGEYRQERDGNQRKPDVRINHYPERADQRCV